jgi:cellulose synthase/poly-beta-1,6-N-acetylglucosamine synthase-like glycosyltransferase
MVACEPMSFTNDTEVAALPFVSVIIPVKNGEGKLEHCLRALQQQTYPAESFEVIVADGASRDRTVEIARAAGARVVENPRQNTPAGRNVGIAAARGSLVAFLDDDCVPALDWLSRGVAALQTGAFDALGGPLPVPEGSTPWSRAVDWVFCAAARGAGAVQSAQTRTSVIDDIPGGNALYRRAALDAVGPYDETLWAEDVDLHLRMRMAGLKLGFCSGFVASHRRRDSVRGFYAQMRRYGIGRVQVFRKQGQGMKAAHFAVSGLGVLGCLVGVTAPGWALFCCAGASTALFAAGLLAGSSASTALLLGPALLVFVAGWSVGTWSELLSPLRATTGW